ncbi:hypothetical protein AVM71_00220 [Piscirickettsia salmonis]|nr:hypothetical protein AVM71_00220 [Piscirickettsia salmonis]
MRHCFVRGKSLYRLNSVEVTRSSYDPYSKNGLGCYTLQKEKMAAIMQGIIANGDDIAFVTAGGIEKKAIKKFFNVSTMSI